LLSLNYITVLCPIGKGSKSGHRHPDEGHARTRKSGYPAKIGMGGNDRSSAHGNLVVSRSQLHVIDKVCFIAEPCAWNALPSDIKLTSSRISYH